MTGIIREEKRRKPAKGSSGFRWMPLLGYSFKQAVGKGENICVLIATTG